jgi:RimJ/RimL family protein N-acetyltransferase
MTVETVRVTPDDWQLWRGLRLAALANAPEAFASTLAEWSGAGDTEQRWRARLEEVALNLVMTCEGEAVGMVSASAPRDDQPVAVLSMWVAPVRRGCGVGDEAIRRVLSWVREYFPASGVELSVKVHNEHAIRLYQRHGFVASGRSPYGRDEMLMRL